MIRLILLGALLFTCGFLHAQISGRVLNEKGEPLPFASVYVKGTSIGTNTNTEGFFQLEVPEGAQQIVFQFLGYKTETRQVASGDEVLEVQLQSQNLELETVEVSANEEDPAYPIIRKAIEKRNYYRDLIPSYRCQTYIKGLQKILDAPEKVLGQEIGDLEGALDSNRQGIVYLSESESVYHFQAPNNRKEVMLSSKVSGDSRGFSFNRASFLDIRFYQNDLDIVRSMVSPIANSAFFYYKFRLEGTFLDEDGRLINKIRVIPKRKADPVFAGHLYITEDLWNIYGANLYATGQNLKLPVIDTLRIQQQYVPIEAPDRWLPLTQALEFRVKVFGFDFYGYFNSQFSEYTLNPEFPNNFFGGEVFRVEDGAQDKNLSYWDSIRPMPLTIEERSDYVRKDSLQRIRESKPFRDSMDLIDNKFGWSDILFGYTWRNSYERKFLTVNAPLSTVAFNSVQGWFGSLDIDYRHYQDEDYNRYLAIDPRIQYGFADEQIRADVSVAYRFNRQNYARIELEGGRRVAQFNENEPVSIMANNIYSLWLKENYLRLYDKQFGRIGYQQELVNGVFMNVGLEYADRRGLLNQSDYSFAERDKDYFANLPGLDVRVPLEDQLQEFDRSRTVQFDLAFRVRIQQKYWQYPNRKFLLGSRFPDIWVRYRKGISGIGNSDVQYDRLSMSLEEDYSLGVVGEIEVFAEAGSFLNENPRLAFMDRYQFIDNNLAVGDPNRYLRGFLAMPFYRYTTNNAWVQLHAEHHFNGFILDKLPLLNQLGWSTVLGASAVWLSEQPLAFPSEPDQWYGEVNLGIDNIGIGILRIFRVDVVASFEDGKYDKTDLVVGIKL